MSMEGKFRQLAKQAMENSEIESGKKPDGSSSNEKKGEDFEKVALEAKKEEHAIQDNIYRLFERVDDPGEKVKLIDDFIEALDAAAEEKDLPAKGIDKVYLEGKHPSQTNQLYQKAKEFIDIFGYEEIRDAALNYKLVAQADWTTPSDRMLEN